ncbi:MAG TPA: zf-HC2 domain-containing protein, partial [Gemmatimonadales bacterium]|nr:zf-HC2 domain-containing protein [Gemmatimonadales bacterium]
MTCAELRARLDAYARDALSRSEASRFEEHLNGCAECQAFLEAAEPRLARTESLARQIEPAPDLWPGIRSRLLPRGAGSRRRFLVPAWMLAAAAVLIVAVSSGVTFF